MTYLGIHLTVKVRDSAMLDIFSIFLLVNELTIGNISDVGFKK